MPKIELAAQGGDRDPRIAHLRPVIEYLLAQGNTPAGWRGDAFAFDQGGEGHYTFTGPIDAAQLRERFAFPASIRVYDDGSIKDSLNRVDIGQESPPLLFSFEGLLATADTIQSPQAPPELPTTDDGTANERLRQIIENRYPEPGS